MYNKSVVCTAWNNGYRCFYDKEHPLATTDGRVFYHRHIVSMNAGRWLQTDEHVHHIDGNKENNAIDNLQIVSIADHRKLHAKVLPTRLCNFCNIEYQPQESDSKFCSTKCTSSSRIKIPELTKEILDELIPNNSWEVLGRMFGYSGTGIKKRAKTLGCTIPKRK